MSGTDEVESRVRREGSVGIIAARKRPDDARYLHPRGVAAKARRQREGRRDDASGCSQKASAPYSALDDVGGGRVVPVNSWY